MARQSTLFDSERMLLVDSLEMSAQSLNAYGERGPPSVVGGCAIGAEDGAPNGRTAGAEPSHWRVCLSTTSILTGVFNRN